MLGVMFWSGGQLIPCNKMACPRNHSGLRATYLSAGQPRGVAKAWSEEEEGRFLEALELYGRDWKACSRHLVSRDAR